MGCEKMPVGLDVAFHMKSDWDMHPGRMEPQDWGGLTK